MPVPVYEKIPSRTLIYKKEDKNGATLFVDMHITELGEPMVIVLTLFTFELKQLWTHILRRTRACFRIFFTIFLQNNCRSTTIVQP